MSRPRRATASVRLRLTIWNVAIFALVLVVLGIVSHYVLQRTMMNALDRRMYGRAQGMLRGLERLTDSERQAVALQGRGRWGLPPRPPELGPSERNNRSDSLRPHRPKILTLASRDYLRGTQDTPYDDEAFARSARGETVRSVMVLDGDNMRVLSMPIRRGGRVDGVYQTVSSLVEVEAALRASTRTLLLMIPVALLVSGLVGAFLTSRALQPVRLLRDAADRIQAESLSERLPAPGRDEFSELAETFNQMLNRLEQAFRQQARFTADASHELRTPLTVLRGNLSLALARPRSAEEYRETLDRAYRATERMSHLVEDLLLLARADAGQLVLDVEPVSLHEVLSSAADALPGREVTLDLPADDAAPLTVRGNRGLLGVLFANLLNNAARHTPPTGSLTIRAVRHRDTVAVRVEDTGEGIPPEHLTSILERFYRVDDSRSSESGGAGLGLAICQSIADAHGGSVAIESQVGQGTTVTVTLPLA